MLRANNLAVRRGSRTVLAGIDVQLHPGRVLGVLGPNGAGKAPCSRPCAMSLRPARAQSALTGKS
jgi:iron complex transport system ATP-binding protein